MFLLQVHCVFENPSNTGDMAIAKSSVSKDEHDRPSARRRDMASELFLLYVYSIPNSQRGGREDRNSFISSLGFCFVCSLMIFHSFTVLSKLHMSSIHFSCCCFLTKYTIVCTCGRGNKPKKGRSFLNRILLKSCPKNKVK